MKDRELARLAMLDPAPAAVLERVRASKIDRDTVAGALAIVRSGNTQRATKAEDALRATLQAFDIAPSEKRAGVGEFRTLTVQGDTRVRFSTGLKPGTKLVGCQLAPTVWVVCANVSTLLEVLGGRNAEESQTQKEAGISEQSDAGPRPD